ncbi:MAG: signal peptidase I [Synergistaceae bacterium]|nr:signal peptidase I [Synergistaceae bacterium]
MKLIKNFAAITTAIVIPVSVVALALVLLGYRPFILLTASMEPMYAKGSLCWVDTHVDLESLEAGDVIIYRSNTNLVVMHRLIEKSGDIAVMKGDTNETIQDVKLDRVNFIGREIFTIPSLGAMFDHSHGVIWFIAAIFLALACVPWEDTKTEHDPASGFAHENSLEIS